uniref:Uncharacterized protein n=1 Tax=Setaria viridis TaxID=4556 RepID=A0A4U6WE39_SETVI|nr:hypothetical protein SEVIR_1G289750v2 [Setaria viridis]
MAAVRCIDGESSISVFSLQDSSCGHAYARTLLARLCIDPEIGHEPHPRSSSLREVEKNRLAATTVISDGESHNARCSSKALRCDFSFLEGCPFGGLDVKPLLLY